MITPFLLASLWVADGPPAGAPGGPPLALDCAKALVCAHRGAQVVDRARVVVRDGRIEAVGARQELAAPSGAVVEDLGALWLVPGFIDLHSHIGGDFGINDMVYQANPELRVSTAVVPENANLRRALAAGVTTILFIPGSGTNCGGQGILLKTAGATFDEMLVREPGSLKIAQADNPARWGYGMGRGMMNWTIREFCSRGRAYARAWAEFESGAGPQPERDLMFDVFRDLYAGRTQVSTHTQVYQVVYNTLRILRQELGLPTYIDHGEFDAFLLGELARELDVAGILGPRSISSQVKSRGVDHDGKIIGLAAGWQEHGLVEIGFNTDAPVVPAEELPLQAAMGVHYGFDDARLQALRGLTIVPARTAGIDDRVGSIEAGKDADLLAVRGDPVDPRTGIERAWVGGRVVHVSTQGGRTW